MLEADRVKLKKRIREKFGSLSNFGIASSTSYQRVLRILNADKIKQKDYDELKEKYHVSEMADVLDVYIAEEDREKIRVCIMTHCRSYAEFCRVNPEYDITYLSNIVNGKLSRVTDKYIKLIELLKDNCKYDSEP